MLLLSMFTLLINGSNHRGKNKNNTNNDDNHKLNNIRRKCTKKSHKIKNLKTEANRLRQIHKMRSIKITKQYYVYVLCTYMQTMDVQ